MKKEILLEGEQHRDFLEEIAALPEGERVLSCLQCGTCSGTCPVATLMDYAPRQIFAMIRAGMRRDVLGSLTPWMCSSCYECTVKCPAQIKITEIMYALKRASIKEGLVSPETDVYRFYKLFTEIVSKYGRMHEMLLLMRYMALHHPVTMMSQLPVGMRMMMTGTMQVQPHRVKNAESFQKIVEKATALDA
jgi:heterodisulfide reductase subunit C